MLAVLRRNPQFRLLWLAQVVSQAGDWLNRIALLTLIAKLGGPSATAGLGALYGVELAVRFLPSAVVGPTLAGPIADRLPRRTLMIASDLVRALLVVGLVFIDEPGELPVLYVLLTLQMSMAIFFDAARSASVPNTVRIEDLHVAYSIHAATWSAMLSIGALAGGVLVGAIGVRGVFLVDSSTYVASAVLLLGLRLPPPPSQKDALRLRDLFFYRDVRRGLAHVRELGIGWIVATKTFWGACGGFLVMLSVVGNVRFGSGGEGGFATGVLFAARGVGTGIGPILARRLFGSGDDALRRQISVSFAVACIGYGAFAAAEDLWLAALFVVVAHTGGSTLWVASTTFWQRYVHDAFRGRVYTLEFVGATGVFALGAMLAGGFYDWTGSIQETVWIVCGVVAVLGATWTVLARGVRSPGLGTPAANADHRA